MAGLPTEAGDGVIVDETRLGKFQAIARIGGNAVILDEPVAVGGLGSGPGPYDLLGAALGACTAMTIRLYADRKGWPLHRVRVSVVHHRQSLAARDRFDKTIRLEDDLDETQRARLKEIAERCPVHLTLDRGADVTTTLGDSATMPPAGDGHMRTMEEAIA